MRVGKNVRGMESVSFATRFPSVPVIYLAIHKTVEKLILVDIFMQRVYLQNILFDKLLRNSSHIFFENRKIILETYTHKINLPFKRITFYFIISKI